MCGISLIVGANGQLVPGELIRTMTNKVAHRGPDDDGYFVERNLALGHRRLSIIDLSPAGHQPMQRGALWITYNGEIYNYIELRDELAALGCTFTSGSDTEVILFAYQKWGVDAFRKLNGMWAFVIYDRTTRRVFGARDRFGVKPLYVFRNADCIVLASEIKSIRDSGLVKLNVNWKTAASFLRLSPPKSTSSLTSSGFAPSVSIQTG